MKTIISMISLLGMSASLLAQKPHKAEVQKSFDAKVVAAMPQVKALAKPAKARKILVLSKTAGWYHSSIETGKTCFAEMSKVSGAFSIDFNDDPSFYTSANLAKYDAILFNNTTYSQDYFNEEQRSAILGFIKNGGGFIGVHAASDCGTSAKKAKSTWPEITEMMGGAFDGHPWTHKGMYGVLNEDPEHKILAPMKGENFEISDELYKFKDYKRENQRVLLTIDMSKSYKKGGRDDHDHALLWVKEYGKGRVFFSAFGHNEHIFYNPMILQTWLNGIQFALGDLDVKTEALPIPEEHKNFKPQENN
ncbi:ThuA domain-containing protein [Lentisphaera marina]|uniref:ThuA domain-containing protein n=1 Tax=Lentisphaera marina TaxID=1111041 RepID=UPI002366CB7A|nr:ThuA domain-containing protein [Lentisphaera marina]MDD7983375.1 ThuA domain-containing protein [Lentisphaera marina]